jgi:hypothetical protein
MPIKSNETPDAEKLRSLLRYDPETGRLYYKVTMKGHIAEGREALRNTTNKGYRRGGVFGKLYMAHRIIWKIVHGYDPPEEIDHINGDRSDNRIENLRLASRSDNTRNTRRKKSNTSGCTGVHPCKRYWVATIRVGSRQVELGYFRDKDLAIKCRKDAERKYGYHPNHGRER